MPMLTEFYNIFYLNGVKRIPTDLSLLTPLALAHLIMQDGSRGTCRGPGGGGRPRIKTIR